MYYHIAELTLFSAFPLPSCSAFSCEPAKPDVTLFLGSTPPPSGKALTAGHLKVHQLPDGWVFHLADGTGPSLAVSADYSNLVLSDADGATDDLDPKAWWLIRIALECALARRGYLSLHAAAVSVDGEAYAFTGPSGLGKSTRARAWQEAFAAPLISGDRPLIHADTMELFGVPWDGKEQSFVNTRVPLRAICDIRRSELAYVRAMDERQRLRLLTRQAFLPMWDTAATAAQMANIVRLAKAAPMVRMFSGPLAGDAKAIRAMLERHEVKKEETDMKVRSDFTLRYVMGDYMLMPAGDNVGQFKGAIVLNDVAAFVWTELENPVSREDLLLAIQNKYDVEQEVAARDLDLLLEKLKNYGVIEEE